MLNQKRILWKKEKEEALRLFRFKMKKIQIMGVLNITPDSFFDGHQDNLKKTNTKIFEKLDSELFQADIVDVGGESSRPGAEKISSEDEIKRISILSKSEILKHKNKTFSIDTYKYEVAKYALENGYKMINDIYAGRYNERIFELSFSYDVPIVLMHMKGNPKNMQLNTNYTSIIDNIMRFFEDRILVAKSYGIPDENIILDPGIGFGKKNEDNYLIIKNISKFKELGFKVLIGLSRKSFLDTNNNIKPKNRLLETICMNSIAAANGADILRVHDVFDTMKIIKVIESYIDC